MTITVKDDFDIERVEFYDGLNLIRRIFNEPFNYTLLNIGLTTQTLSFLAFDHEGMSTSDEVAIIVKEGVGCVEPT